MIIIDESVYEMFFLNNDTAHVIIKIYITEYYTLVNLECKFFQIWSF